MQNYELLNFKINGNATGKLVAIEALNQIPFEIKRIFYIYGVKGDAIRGRHSNRNSEFVMINVKGSADIRLHDGNKEHIVNLSKPNEGLYIPKLMWKDMYNFSDDCVMLVLSSEVYDENEYIRDFDEFLKEVSKNE